MSEQERAGIAANVNLIRESLPKDPPQIHKAALAGLNLLETFLQNIADIAEANRPQVMLAEGTAEELTEDAIMRHFNPPPEGQAQKLSKELADLCFAETEGKFFDRVTDNITLICAALDAYIPPKKPETGDGSLMAEPKEGTKPFRSPASDQIVKAPAFSPCSKPDCKNPAAYRYSNGVMACEECHAMATDLP